jgi:ubiquinone/menaquinone biosynthesis C-methylase UbiE
MSEPRSFDRVAQSYDETRGGEERGRLFANEIHPRLATDGLALEIGIGTGVVANGLADLGRRVVGIDVAALMLAHAIDRIGPRVAVADARFLPLRAGIIDNSYSVWVLHLVDGSAVMAEVARVLRPRGRFVVCPAVPPTPDPITDVLRVMYDRLRGADPQPDEAARLVDMAKAAGLRVVVSELCAPQFFYESPETVARRLEARSPSALWDIDATMWEAVVVPTIDALRALPDPDRIIERSAIAPILVFER